METYTLFVPYTPFIVEAALHLLDIVIWPAVVVYCFSKLG